MSAEKEIWVALRRRDSAKKGALFQGRKETPLRLDPARKAEKPGDTGPQKAPQKSGAGARP